MSFVYNFVKEDSGRWYIDYPDFPGDKENLEMVCGADTLLEILGQGERKVPIHFSLQPFNGSSVLTKTKDGEDEGGAYYWFASLNGVNYGFELWLCDVTLHVFSTRLMPIKIYFK